MATTKQEEIERHRAEVKAADPSLDERLNAVYSAFNEVYEAFAAPVAEDVMGAWVEKVWEDHVVACVGDEQYEIGYTMTDGEIAFAPREEWQKVEKVVEYQPVAEAKRGARNSGKDQARLQTIHDYAAENGAACAKKEITIDPETLVYQGGEIKSLGAGLIGGYLVRFTSAEDPDLTGDYFTAKTDFGEPSKLPVLYQHGFDAKVGKRRIGTAAIKADDVGLWAETQLNLHDEYEQAINALAEAGKLGYSSGAAAHAVDREQGEKAAWIKQWYIAEASLTPTPAEPRNTVTPLKSLLSDNTQAAKQEDGQDKPASVAPVGTTAVAKPNQSGVKTMEINDELKELMGNVAKSSAAEAVDAYIAKTEPVKGADVHVVKDEADQPFPSTGDYFMAVKSAALNPGAIDPRLLPLKATGMSEGVPSEGGFLLQPQVAAGIFERMYETGSILSRISLDNLGPNANTMLYNGVDETSRADGSRFGGIQGYWLAEGASKTASKGKFYQLELKLKKVAALAYATDELLGDSAALGGWINRTVPEELKFKIEDAIVNGLGGGQPAGIMGAAALVAVTRVDASKIQVADVAAMLARLWGNNGVWLCDKSCLPQLVSLAITYPVYLPAGGLSAAPFDTLFGKPVLYTEHNAAMGTVGDILLCDLSQYQGIQKGGIEAASSIHVQFLTDETVFRFVYRFDGGSMWKSALTPKNAGATLSPFVSLSTSS